MSLAAQQELVGAGRGFVLASAPLAPDGTAKRVPGGFRAQGRWRYASGVAHAEWTLVACTALEDGEAIPWMFLVPVSAVSVHDEWHVSGISATSSTNLSAADLFVPETRALELERVYSPADHPGAVHEESIYRYPILPGLLAMLAAIALGSAEGALELARAKLFKTAPWGVPRIDRAPSRARAGSRAIDPAQETLSAPTRAWARSARSSSPGDLDRPQTQEGLQFAAREASA